MSSGTELRWVTAVHRASLDDGPFDTVSTRRLHRADGRCGILPTRPTAGGATAKEPAVTVSRVRAIKVPPYSVHSEKVVLGSMIAEPTLIASISRIIPSGESFFRPEHGRIFDAVIQRHQRHKPTTTKDLLHALQAHGLVERLGGESLLRELARENADPAAAADQAQIVANKAKMRWFIDAISDSLHDAYYSHDDYEAVLERTRVRLAELDQTTT